MLKQPGRDVIHIIPQEYTINDESGITDPIGAVGSRLSCKIHAAVANISAIEMLKTVLVWQIWTLQTLC